jgi:hypothetical protein
MIFMDVTHHVTKSNGQTLGKNLIYEINYSSCFELFELQKLPCSQSHEVSSLG